MTLPDQATEDTAPPAARAFGVENRARLLDAYFDSVGAVEPGEAWAHVYRLLLWIDRTTGLAHCYESDKSQAGRPWYARSLAFHAWTANALHVPAADLGEHIDQLFRNVTADLARAAASARAQRLAAAAAQRAPYEALGLPQPGEDPELEGIITDTLSSYLVSDPPTMTLRLLTERIQAHVGQENKRKNLVGEGFEDTVAALLRRTVGIGTTYDVLVRPVLDQIPGFRPPRAGSKQRQVDLALVHHATQRRTLVSCKWSVRSDREEQFASDFRDYAELEDAGEDFAYVLVTNEFDPARLAAACDMRRQNAPLFSDVVHVNTAGVAAAYSAAGSGSRASAGQERALERMESRRLVSLDTWLQGLESP